jgi:hypothetical protein
MREALQKVGRGPPRFGLVPLSDAEAAVFLVKFGLLLAGGDAAPVLGPLFEMLAGAAGRAPPRFAAMPGDPSYPFPPAVAQVLLEDHARGEAGLFFDRVAAALDFPDAAFPSSAPAALNFVVSVVTIGAGTFPTKYLVAAPWRNARAQAEALLCCIKGAQQLPPLARLQFGYGAAPPARVLEPLDPVRPPFSSLFTSLDAYGTLLRLSMSADQGAVQAAQTVLDFAAAPGSAPELVLLAMAHSKTESRVELDTTGLADTWPARSKLYQTMLTVLFGPLFTTPVAQPPDRAKAALLGRLWAISPMLAVISLLSLANRIAAKMPAGGDEAVALRATLEGASRAVKLLCSSGLALSPLLSCPAPLLALDAALVLADPEADGELRERLAAEKLLPLRLDAWLAALLNRGPLSEASKWANAACALLLRAAGAQTRDLQRARAELHLPLEGPAEGAPGGAEEAVAQAEAARGAAVSADHVGALLRALRSAADARLLSPEAAGQVEAATLAVRRVYQLDAPAPVKELFSQVFAETLPVPAFLERVRAAKADHDTTLFHHFGNFCFNLNPVRSPTASPDLMGVLFGQFIYQGFFRDDPVAKTEPPITQIGLALKTVLGRVENAPRGGDLRSFRFGVWALEQIKTLWPKYPNYMARYKQIAHVRALFPDFCAELDAATSQKARGADGSGAFAASLVPGDPLRPGPGADAWAAELERRWAELEPVGLLERRLAEGLNGPAIAAAVAAPVGPPRAHAPVGSPAYANELRDRFSALGADLSVALSALAEGRPIPTILPSAVAAAAAAKEAEESAAAAATSGSDASSSATGSLEEPPPAVIDRVHFLFNNLSEDNVPGTVAELAKELRPEYVGWFASYLTLKRACGQANYQPLHLAVLERLERDHERGELSALALKVAVDASKKYLAKPNIRNIGNQSSTDRKNLKDLGQWIGRLTLAKSKPLLHRNLFLRELLHEAYETGRLVAVVAFVAKIMESCKDSPVFRPPNPWTLSVLQAMRELHELPPLKLNLKFEVEQLAKTLSVELKNLAPSTALQKRRKPTLQDPQWPNHDFQQGTVSAMLPGITARDAGGGAGGSVGTMPQIPGLLGLVTLRTMGPIFHRTAEIDYAAISAAVREGPGEDPGADEDEPGSAKAVFRNVVAVALDHNLRELIEPVVSRSTKIAGKTAMALILKDFALEADADKMMRAAQMFAADLAGSLAVSTVLEPLTARTQAKLEQLIKANSSVLTNLPVEIAKLDEGCVMKLIGGVVTENMQLGSLLVEKAAIDQMQRDIAEMLEGPVKDRRRAVETRTPMQLPPGGGRWPAALPEELRLRPTGLTAQQMRTFETSFRSGGAGAEEALHAAPAPHEAAPAGEAMSAEQMLTPSQGLEEFHKLFSESQAMARTLCRQRTRGATFTLPPDHELLHNVRARVRKISSLLAPGDHREQCVLRTVAAPFKGLFTQPDCEEPVMQQFFFVFLQSLGECTQRLQDTLIKYVPQVQAEMLFRPSMGDMVLVGLLRHKLLNPRDVDDFLIKVASQPAAIEPSAPGTQFFLRVLDRAILVDKVVPHDALAQSHEKLIELARRHPRVALKPGQLSAIALAQAIKEAQSAPPLSLAPLPPDTPVLAVQSRHVQPSQPGLERALEAAEAVRRNPQLAYTEQQRSQMLYWLEMWVRLNGEPDGEAKNRSMRQFYGLLQAQGVLNEDQLDQFMRVLMDLCTQSCAVTALAFAPEEARSSAGLQAVNATLFGPTAVPVPTPEKKLTYMGVDALAKLIQVLLKSQSGKGKMLIHLQQILTFITKALIKEADSNCGGSTEALAAGGVLFMPSPKFDGRPYLRLLTQLFPLTQIQPFQLGMEPLDPAALQEIKNFNAQVLATFANMLHITNPSRVPGFAFAWLELLSHRALTPELLAVSMQRGWMLVHRLLMHALRFMYPYLRRGELNDGLRLFYKGLLRLLVVLVHDDTPEFVADYAWSLCEAVPLHCLQLRNIILSAAPAPLRGREGDYFGGVLGKPETVLACALLPRVLRPPEIVPEPLRVEVMLYLNARPPIRGQLLPLPREFAPLVPTSVLPLPAAAEAAARALVPLLLADAEEQALVLSRYSLRAINGLCLLLVSETLKYLLQEAGGGGAESRSLRVNTAASVAAAVGTGAAELFRALIAELDAEGRYALLATAATHLRYPNAHTLFFHRLFLMLWASSDTDATREIIARVLAERLVVSLRAFPRDCSACQRNAPHAHTHTHTHTHFTHTQAHAPHPWGLRVTFAELVRAREGAEAGVLFTCAFARPPNPASALFARLAATAKDELAR